MFGTRTPTIFGHFSCGIGLAELAGISLGQTAACHALPPGQVRGWFLFLLLFLELASGTICSTIGCNFTPGCTFPLKLHSFFSPPFSETLAATIITTTHSLGFFFSAPFSFLVPSRLCAAWSPRRKVKLSTMEGGKKGEANRWSCFERINCYLLVGLVFKQHVCCAVLVWWVRWGPWPRFLSEGGRSAQLRGQTPPKRTF